MKIGIVCYPTFGGSGVVATELGKLLANRGHIVHFITYNRPVRLDQFLTNIYYHEVAITNYPLFEYTPYESALTAKIVDVILHHNLDLLHVHYAIPHASSAYLAQQILKKENKFIPFITTLHGTDITLVGKDKAYSPIVKFSIEMSNGITCVSDYLKSITMEQFGINQPIEVIPNFISVKDYQNHQQQKNKLRSSIENCKEKILIHASNFRKVKRVQDVFYIFQSVQKEIDCKLYLIGDGPERMKIQELVDESGLNNQVIFLGNQIGIDKILPIGDLFLLPSDHESFGLAALEAMSCGLPVIGTKAGGLPEVVENGISGYLDEIGHIEAMSNHVKELLSDSNLLKKFGIAAYERAKKFDSTNIIQQYEQLYQKHLTIEI